MPDPQNTSGYGRMAVIPDEIRGWNWVAIFLNWIWGIGNGTWIALLCWVPYVNFVMPFVLGAKGSAWAWQNKRWESVERFRRVQQRWARWGFGVFIVVAVVVLLLVLAAAGNSASHRIS